MQKKSYLWQMLARKSIIHRVKFLWLILFLSSCTLQQEKKDEASLSDENERSFAYGICIDSLHLNRYIIQQGDNLASILSQHGFNGTEREQITGTISPLYPPSGMQIGNGYAVITTPDSLATVRYLVFESSKTDFVVVDLCSDTLRA